MFTGKSLTETGKRNGLKLKRFPLLGHRFQSTFLEMNKCRRRMRNNLRYLTILMVDCTQKCRATGKRCFIVFVRGSYGRGGFMAFLVIYLPCDFVRMFRS